mmetsp:Transcript_42196/g.84564  ORF Transcript_42196/g.84564 Transcript_42196/m.84564 type:complete len:234 (-) Transcript_42196:183-884(-)
MTHWHLIRTGEEDLLKKQYSSTVQHCFLPMVSNGGERRSTGLNRHHLSFLNYGVGDVSVLAAERPLPASDPTGEGDKGEGKAGAGASRWEGKEAMIGAMRRSMLAPDIASAILIAAANRRSSPSTNDCRRLLPSCVLVKPAHVSQLASLRRSWWAVRSSPSMWVSGRQISGLALRTASYSSGETTSMMVLICHMSSSWSSNALYLVHRTNTNSSADAERALGLSCMKRRFHLQ